MIESRQIRQGTIFAAIINVLGMAFKLTMDQSVPGHPMYLSLISVAVGCTVLFLLFYYEKTISNPVIKGLYILNSLSVTTVFFISDQFNVIAVPNWVPFQSDKLGCLVVALTAPSLGVGLFAVSAHFAAAMFNFFMFPVDIQQRFAIEEPRATIAFALVGVLTLVYRMRKFEMEKKFYEAEAETLSYKNLAHAFMELRDLMNTPLQIVELSLAQLKETNIEQIGPIVERLQKASLELKNINEILSRYESEIDWRRKDRFLAIKDL